MRTGAELKMTITLHQGVSGKWRATKHEGNTQEAVFGENAKDALGKLMRFVRG